MPLTDAGSLGRAAARQGRREAGREPCTCQPLLRVQRLLARCYGLFERQTQALYRINRPYAGQALPAPRASMGWWRGEKHTTHDNSTRHTFREVDGEAVVMVVVVVVVVIGKEGGGGISTNVVGLHRSL